MPEMYFNSLEKVKSIGFKSGTEYFVDNYGTIFCDAIEQSNMVGGGNEEPRNEIENPIRLARHNEFSFKFSITKQTSAWIKPNATLA